MGSLFRPKITRYVDRETGVRVSKSHPGAVKVQAQSQTWWCEYVDENGCVRRESLGVCGVKKKSEATRLLVDREQKVEAIKDQRRIYEMPLALRVVRGVGDVVDSWTSVTDGRWNPPRRVLGDDVRNVAEALGVKEDELIARVNASRLHLCTRTWTRIVAWMERRQGRLERPSSTCVEWRLEAAFTVRDILEAQGVDFHQDHFGESIVKKGVSLAFLSTRLLGEHKGFAEYALDGAVGHYFEGIHQNTSSYVYFLQPSRTRVVKVGFASSFESLQKRLQSARIYNWKELQFLAYFPATASCERIVHRRLARFRVRGEWFRLCPEVELTICSAVLSTACVGVGSLPTCGVGDATVEQQSKRSM